MLTDVLHARDGATGDVSFQKTTDDSVKGSLYVDRSQPLGQQRSILISQQMKPFTQQTGVDTHLISYKVPITGPDGKVYFYQMSVKFNVPRGVGITESHVYNSFLDLLDALDVIDIASDFSNSTVSEYNDDLVLTGIIVGES